MKPQRRPARAAALASLVALFASGLAAPPTASAEPDTFGLGDGHKGPLNVPGATSVTVNAYARSSGALAIGATQIAVDSAVGFAAGDLVMAYQATGLAAVPGPGMPGPFDLSASAVGHFELARVSAVNGNILMLGAPLVSAFDAGATQVVLVPEYSSVVVNAGATIVPRKWDGATGGVVAFLSQGLVQIAGSINADGAGGRGGAFANDANASHGCTGLDEPAPRGAQKGEGVAITRFGSTQTGYGNVANGPGGGICHNGGGGGGGNGGKGGKGGQTTGGDGTRAVGGDGGAALSASLIDHLFLGAGGGAGHGDNGAGGTGGAGGGVILLRAAGLSGTGTLSASGAAGGDASKEDGAAGGGAGGSISIRVTGNLGCGTVRASGGKGGNAAMDDHAPGGGGGYGRVLVQASMQACSVAIAPGPAGTQPNTFFQSAQYGASDGDGSGSNTPERPPGGYCTLDAQCMAPTPHCLPTMNACVACRANTDCAAPTPICDTRSRTCRACAGDTDCSAPTPACQLSGPSKGSCAECSAQNATGCGGSRPVCDAPTGMCRACAADKECGVAAPVCSLGGQDQGACVQCGPMNQSACTAQAPACDVNRHACVPCIVGGDPGVCKVSADGRACIGAGNAGNGPRCGCTTDADCGATDSGRVCDAPAQKCIDGCSASPTRNHCPKDRLCTNLDPSGASTSPCSAPCTTDKDCKAPTPFCLPASGATPAHCGACRGDADCANAPGTAVCETGQCVECTPGPPPKATACLPALGGAVCLPSRHCGCTTDSDCGSPTSARVCDDSRQQCEPGCRGSGGNGCAGDDRCSSSTSAIGSCAPALSVPDGGSVAVTGGGACAIGPSRRGDRGLGAGAIGLFALGSLLVRRRRWRFSARSTQGPGMGRSS